MFAARRKEIKPLPFRIYGLSALLLVLGGMADAVYLTVSHYRVYTDIGYKSFCALTKSINCDTVAQSAYAVFLGVPTAFWGVLGYALLLVLVLLAFQADARPQRLWPLLMLVTLFCTLVNVALAFVSIFRIGSYCIMCILSYAITFLLLFQTWLIYRRFNRNGFMPALRSDLRHLVQRPKRLVLALGPWVLAVVVALAVYPHYWQLNLPPLSASLPRGLTADGHPWIGARDPELEIIEFTDYMCFQCRKTHFMLRAMVERHPERIRLVHRHFPMDHQVNPLVTEPMHVGAGKLALMAIGGAREGKFWETNDVLFSEAHGKETLSPRFVAEKLEIDPKVMAVALADPLVQLQLKIDIRDGIQLGLKGTPGFLVEGELYVGELPVKVLERFLRD